MTYACRAIMIWSRKIIRLIKKDTMDIKLKTSESGQDFIKKCEGLRLSAYLDEAGYGTIGYGHKLTPQDTMSQITLPQAEALFMHDLSIVEDCINEVVKIQLNQNQFDALSDFTFNLGTGTLRYSPMLRLLNTGIHQDVALQHWLLYDHVNGVVSTAIYNRRFMEVQIFKRGDEHAGKEC